MTSIRDLGDLSPTRALIEARRLGLTDPQRNHNAADAAALIDPGREPQEYDPTPPPHGWPAGRGLGRRKES